MLATMEEGLFLWFLGVIFLKEFSKTILIISAMSATTYRMYEQHSVEHTVLHSVPFLWKDKAKQVKITWFPCYTLCMVNNDGATAGKGRTRGGGRKPR